jgi:hypothetical protein
VVWPGRTQRPATGGSKTSVARPQLADELQLSEQTLKRRLGEESGRGHPGRVGSSLGGASTRRLGFTSNAEPSASKEVSKRRCPWERENRRSDVGQDRSTKDVARANLAAHIDSIARPRPPGRPRAVDWHALSQDARVSVSHTSRGRTSSRLHLATCSRARPRALVVAQPSDAGGCATLISDTGSGRCWAVRGGRARLMAETLVSAPGNSAGKPY